MKATEIVHAALTDEDRAYLETLIPSIGVAWNKGDRMPYIDRYADDCVYMVPNQELLRGKAAVREFVLAFPDVKAEFSTVEVGGCTSAAYIQGTYTLRDPEGNLMDKGKFLDIMRKNDAGDWEGTHDIWNSDLPVAATG